MKSVEYLIVGSGLTGAVIARLLADAGRDILIVEMRNHLGGNIHDYTHPSGIKVHAYGPHYFRCNSEKIWQFVNRFSKFYKYEAKVKTIVDGKLEDWPINQSYLNKLSIEERQPKFNGVPLNFEQACMSMMSKSTYEKFIKEYTIKQWGVNPEYLSPDLAKRLSIYNSLENRLTPNHKFQGIPEKGYSDFILKLLNDIPYKLNYKYKAGDSELTYSKKIIYSGPIDEYFNYKFGHLRYRGQLRKTTYFPNLDHYQEYAQINNPEIKNGPFIRTIEWKYLASPFDVPDVNGTVITREYPFDPLNSNNFEYPFPDRINESRYNQYRKLAKSFKDVIICGRLGEYRYFDMDQAIENAMDIAKNILQN